MIFHVTDESRWARSLTEGTHTGSTLGVELAHEGYIHCSNLDQVAGVLQRYYQGIPDLVLLHVDEALLTSPVVHEQLGGAPEPFPHVYGPINLDAVVQVERMGDPSMGHVDGP